MEEEKKQKYFAVVDDIGRAIAQLRQFRGLTIEEAAKKSGLTEKRLAAIERGRLTTNLNVLTNHVEALGGRLAIVPEESPEDPHCIFIELEN